MPWTLRKTVRFEAAHQLPHHDGKCARLHGHSWVMHVEVQGVGLYQGGPKVGMLVDYADISQAIAPLIENTLDHYYLNESTGLKNPTSEELSRWVWCHLPSWMQDMGLSVTIEETCTTGCRYAPDLRR